MIPSTITHQPLSPQLKHIELGKTLVKKGLFNDALDHFKKSMDIHPDMGIDILIYLYQTTSDTVCPNTLLLIANIYLEMTLFSEAFDVFEDIFEQDIHHEATYDRLSNLALKKSLTPKIRPIFERAIAQNIYYPSIIGILPTLYIEEKNYQKAIDLYQKLNETFPEDYQYYKILSELHFRQRHYEAASDILSNLITIAPFKAEELIQPIEQILKKIPRNYSVRVLMANILFRAFKPSEGCHELRQLMQYHTQKKDDILAELHRHQGAFPNHPDIILLTAELLIDTHQYTESLPYLQDLCNHSTTHSDSALLLMQTIIQHLPHHCLALEIIGCIYFKQENMAQALHYYNQCVDYLPTTDDVSFLDNILSISQNQSSFYQPNAALLLAKIKAKSNQADEALSIVDTLKTTNVALEATLLKATILNTNHRFSESQDILKNIMTDHPFNWDIHTLQTQTFRQQLHEKLTEYDTADHPNDLGRITHAFYLFADHQLSKGISTLQKINTNSLEYAHAQRLIARGYFELSRYDLASQIYQRSIKNSTCPTQLKDAHYWQALCDLMLSNDEQALQQLDTVTTFDQSYLHANALADKLRKQKFLNHNGLIICGHLTAKIPQLLIRKNHLSYSKKKAHPFEVIGFSQSYNDEGCKQVIKNQYKAARESFELAIQMDPNFHIPLINLATLELLEKQPPAAILNHLTVAESITHNCPYLHFIKSQYAIYKKQHDHAQRDIQKAIKLLPTDSLFFMTLGDLYYHDFQFELATTYWQKADAFMDIAHIIQHRYRWHHFEQLTVDYWASPEMVTLR